MTEDTAAEKKPEYRDSRRWIVMLAFSVLSFSTAAGLQNLNGIPDCAALYYSKAPTQIMQIVNSSDIIYVVLGWLAIPLLSWRLDYSLIGAAIFSCAGFWMRYFAGHSFFTAFAGSTLISISQITILPAYIYLPEVWFPVEQRNLAFGVPFYFNLLGLNFGLLFPAFFTTPPTCDLATMQFVCAIISTVTVIISCLFIKNKPKAPPVKRHLQGNKLSHKKSLNMIFCNVFNLFNVAVLGLFLGVGWSSTAVIGIVFDEQSILYGGPYYSMLDVALMVACFSASGIIGGFATSIMIMKAIKHNIKPTIDYYMRIFLLVGCVSLMAVSILLIYNVNIYFLYTLLLSLAGFGVIGYIPSACQSLVETSFPARELVSSTVFFIAANLFSQIFNKLTTINELQNNGLIIIPIGMILPLCYIIFCYETNFKRYIFNQKRSTSEKIEFEMVSNDESPAKTENLLQK